jgi:hypothetical protein
VPYIIVLTDDQVQTRLKCWSQRPQTIITLTCVKHSFIKVVQYHKYDFLQLLSNSSRVVMFVEFSGLIQNFKIWFRGISVWICYLFYFVTVRMRVHKAGQIPALRLRMSKFLEIKKKFVLLWKTSSQ